MSKPSGMSSTLSMRGGALVLQSITLFLASGRSAKVTTQNQTKPKIRPKRRMNDKDNKCSSKLVEIAKKDTHFTRYDFIYIFKIELIY